LQELIAGRDCARSSNHPLFSDLRPGLAALGRRVPIVAVGVLLAVSLPLQARSTPLDGDGRAPSDDRRRELTSTICEAEPSFCRCSDDASASPTVVRTVAGQFVDPQADEVIAHLGHCETVASAIVRRAPNASDAESAEDWELVALHRGVDTRTCRRFDVGSDTDRLICHRTIEGDTWRIGFFHALAFSPDGYERRQLSSYGSNARGCPTDVLRTEHPLDWRIWHVPDDPRPALVTLFFQHRNGRVPEPFAEACEAMRGGEPVFGSRRRVTEYFEWTGRRFAFAGATRRRGDQQSASWTTSERLEAPICRRRDVLDRIANRRDGLRRCYADTLGEDRTAAGTLELKWTIGSDGSVDQIEVLTDGLENAKLRTCVRRLVAAIEFPPPRGGDTCSFVYPFEFGAPTDDAPR